VSWDRQTLAIMPDAGVGHVHLLRHGEVETGAERVCRGHADVPLSALGLEQTDRAARALLSRWSPDRVVSSDLGRCRALAEALSPHAELTPRLREQHMGAWEGRTWRALTAEDPAGVTAYWDDYVNARPTGGEAWRETFQRVVRWWEEQDVIGRRVVVVTHVGVIRALLCHWLGLGPEQGLRWAPAYATETRVIVGQAGVVVEAVGDASALTPPPPAHAP
jgi:broad specificity phosphatase PhoE